MNQYTIASKKERICLFQLQKLRNDFEIITLTPIKGFDKYDAIILSGGTYYICEIKVRKHQMSEYNGWLIEKDKYDFLIDKFHTEELVPLYINFHPNGCQVWDLINATTPEWIEKSLPGNSQDAIKTNRNKMQGDLIGEESTKYKYDIDYVKLQIEATNE